MPRIPRPDQRRLDVRVPADLYDAVNDAAERDDRSVNGEVVALLREALAARAKRRR